MASRYSERRLQQNAEQCGHYRRLASEVEAGNRACHLWPRGDVQRVNKCSTLNYTSSQSSVVFETQCTAWLKKEKGHNFRGLCSCLPRYRIAEILVRTGGITNRTSRPSSPRSCQLVARPKSRSKVETSNRPAPLHVDRSDHRAIILIIRHCLTTLHLQICGGAKSDVAMERRYGPSWLRAERRRRR